MSENITMLRGIMKSAAGQRRPINQRIMDIDREIAALRGTKQQLENEVERLMELENSAMRLIINLGGKIDG